MKTCTRCKQEKDFLLFAKRSSSSDGLASWCKKCFAEHAAERYQNGDRVRKEANKAKTFERSTKYIWEYFKTHPCVDCGHTDPRVLEFDHRDESQKTFTIAEMYYRSVSSIAKEIEKCDVRCANCHRIRTINQFGWWRGTM